MDGSRPERGCLPPFLPHFQRMSQSISLCHVWVSVTANTLMSCWSTTMHSVIYIIIKVSVSGHIAAWLYQ